MSRGNWGIMQGTIQKHPVASSDQCFQVYLQYIMYKHSSEKANSTLKSKRNIKLEERSESVTNITHTSQRNHRFSKHHEIKHLNLDLFKSIPCSVGMTHNHKNCVFYHNPKDRRRPGSFYSAHLCKFLEENKKCPLGDQCLEAHSRVEQLYRSDTYKTKFCSHYPNNIQTCEYREFCSFAHSEDEILIELIHNLDFDDDFYMFSYKTVFCPFNLTEHDKALCVYAHNWQDFRRKPSYYSYQPIACPNWELKGFVSDYATEGCARSFACHLCHGWKELEYHWMNYRTKKCSGSACKKGQCHNYHSEKERRTIQQAVHNNIFRIVPRYRIVEGTFKHDYNTGFKVKVKTEKDKSREKQKEIEVKQESEQKEEVKTPFKDKTMVIFKNTRIIEQKNRSKTTVNLASSKGALGDIGGGKWVQEAEVFESQDQESREQETKEQNHQVSKLLNAIGLFDSEQQ